MKRARVPAEQLPPPIDLEDLARRHGLTLSEATELIQIQEWRGNCFSRIDPETGMLRWYWRA